MTHHGAGLRRLIRDEALVTALIEDFRAAPLAPADRAMLVYVEKLTRDPSAMTREDLAPLREAGLDDAAILDICQVAGYFAFVNRMADGLGVELER